MNIFGLKITTTKHYNELVSAHRLQSKAAEFATGRAVKAERSWSLLWNALGDILEMATEKPNGSVVKMLARAEDALQADELTNVKPARKWSKRGES